MAADHPARPWTPQTRLLTAVTVFLVALGVVLVGLAVTRGPDLPAAAPPVVASTTDVQAGPPSPPPTPPPTSSEPAPATSATTTSAAAPLPGLPPANPTHLRIPSIGVDASLIHLGLTPDGALEVPVEASPVGWFTGSPSPGADGPAVLAGHVTYNGARGVFFRLSALQPGADIEVTRDGAPTAVFTVTALSSFAKDTFPTAQIYGHTDGPELRLITCAGDYDPIHHSYPDNLVVFARLTATQP